MVEPFALLAHSVAVKPASVAEQEQYELKVLANKLHVLLAGSYKAVGIIYFYQHSGLAYLEIVRWDGVVEVGVDQLLLPAL